MLYHLFKFLKEHYDLAGAGLFQYITFRALGAAAFSMFLGLAGQMQKMGTPTMGGVIIIGATVVPVLLFARLENIYIILLLATILWMGFVGFLDDYIKTFKKKKEGLQGKFKIVGQVALGLVVGLTLYAHPDVVVREFQSPDKPLQDVEFLSTEIPQGLTYKDVKSTRSTIPFVKHNELDYADFVPFFKEHLTWVLYVLVVVFIITAVSNGANLTDGIDGLAAGSSGIIVVTLGLLAYLSGNFILADYLNIMYLPGTGEVVVFCSALTGACIGFLWYNSYPAQVFMGDTGSLSLGAAVAVAAIIIRKELLLPLLCGVFLIETLSVMLQVSYFKYTKKKFGEGRRIFKMSPLHHHYQKLGIHESKIVTRFWIVGILLAIAAVATLKVR